MRTITIILIFSMLFSMFTPVFSQEQAVVDPAKYKRNSRLNSLGLCFLALGTGCSIATISLASSARDTKDNTGICPDLGGLIAGMIVIPTGASFLIAGTILFVKSKVEMNKIKKLHISTGINEIRLIYDF